MAHGIQWWESEGGRPGISCAALMKTRCLTILNAYCRSYFERNYASD